MANADRDIKRVHAVDRRCEQANSSTGLSQTFYDMGKSYLTDGKVYESLVAYAKAIELSDRAPMLDMALESLGSLAIDDRGKLPASEWIRRLLLIARATKFPTNEAIQAVKKVILKGYEPIAEPVVVIAGGYDSSVKQHMRGYREFVLGALVGFKGTLISGGMTGVFGGLVGGGSHQGAGAFQTIYYVPRQIHAEVLKGEHHSEVRYTEGNGLSVLEPLQYWIDITASDIYPSQVKLLGINGGTIAAAEYRVALALGAYVAIIKDSGGEVARLFQDNDWCASQRLLLLPKDVMTVRVFIEWGNQRLAPDVREAIGQAIHKNYRHARVSTIGGEDPSVTEWEKLPANLKESNRQQADDIFNKLRQIGCAAHRVSNRQITLMQFTNDEIETMAAMEHARWNIERFLDGWRWGKKRDVAKKTSPYLVGWSELPEDIRERDKEAVRAIPELLAAIRMEVYRQ